MIGSPYHIIQCKQANNLDKCIGICKVYDLSPVICADHHFVIGTMFMARANIFPPLLSKLHFSDFDITNPYNKGLGGLAYFMEKYFGAIAGKILPGARSPEFERKSKWFGLRRIFWQHFQTNHGRRIIRILGIPVWWKKIRNL